MTNKIKVVSLFSGVGGLDYGFHKNDSFEVVFANDFNKDACQTYRHNFKQSAHTLKEGDVAKFITDLPEYDLLLGGFPCQAYSLAGKRMGFEDDAKDPKTGVPLLRGMQYLNVVKALMLKKPSLFILENVKGLLSHSFEANGVEIKTLNVILSDLRGCGYKVNYELVTMSDYGVPQRRQRVILCGVRDGVDINPKDLMPQKPLIDKSLKLKDNLPFGSPSNEILNHNLHTGDKKGTKLGWIKILKEGENLKDLTQEEIDKRFLEIGLPTRLKPKSLLGYRRLDGEDVAPTMMFGNTCLPIHPHEDRSISVREAAYLQGFPEDFYFCGGIAAQYKQVGNAVPPLFSQFLADNISKIFKK